MNMAKLKIFNYKVTIKPYFEREPFRIRAHTKVEAEKKMKKYTSMCDYARYELDCTMAIPDSEYDKQYKIYVSENEVVKNGR